MYRSNKLAVLLMVVFILTAFNINSLFAHCQIPCGIYNDEMRVHMIQEDLLTIEKSMKEIIELSKAGDKNYNQLVRWVTNKEDHANKIQEIVDKYYLTQRIKPVDPAKTEAYKKYSSEVVVLHQMLVYAMKTKQTTDLANVEKLRSLLGNFVKLYFDADAQNRLSQHHH